MTRSVLTAALCVLAALSCGDSGTGPYEPAEPTGKLLVFDQISTIYVVDLATGDSREVSVDGEPFFWVSATFDAGANVVIGGSTGVGQPSRGIRQLDLASGAITTLVEGVNGFAASLAPDGKTLAYAVVEGPAPPAAMFTMELGSGGERERRCVAPGGAQQQSIADLGCLPDQSGLTGNLYDLP